MRSIYLVCWLFFRNIDLIVLCSSWVLYSFVNCR